ncbi:MAG: beta-galactosidase trimerization domain-containing protein [Candidatus Latescibacteria bacterium]|nr:beta-galactosidase trimerization domain-containing protein [Candidatus Latescibacterota bacterium]
MTSSSESEGVIQRMPSPTPSSDRLSRLLVYWTPSNLNNLFNHLARARPQILQIGLFGPDLYSLIHTDCHESWLGLPMQNLREACDWWQTFIADVHGMGIKVVGIFSVTYHYGDEDTREGWFTFWDNWDETLLGPRPCDDPLTLLKRTTDGQGVSSAVPGRPLRQYAGCLNNPNWRDVLKGMVKVGVDLGLDGFNTVFNYMGCHCQHCVEGFRAHIAERYTAGDLKRLFGINDLTTHTFPSINWFYGDPPDLYKQECLTFNGLALKRAQDEIFGDFGMGLKTDLIRATWYHSYGGDGAFVHVRNDERSGLPRSLWAKDETYVWYCLGAEKSLTDFAKGYVGDITLEAKYYAAAGRGKPFIANKYDYGRYRLYIAEAAANRAIAFGFNWDAATQHGDREIESYFDTISRYFGFLETHADLYDSIDSYADVAMVFSWTGVERGDATFLRPMKRLARRLIDRHIPFDVLIDQDFTADLLRRYRVIILPDIRYVSHAQWTLLQSYVAAGGKLILTEDTGRYDEHGVQRPVSDVLDLVGDRISIPQDEVKLGPDRSTLIPPRIEDDVFGNAFIDRLEEMIEAPVLKTTAPWTVQITLYHQDRQLIVHCVNYHRDETQTFETPVPSDPSDMTVRLPDGLRTHAVSLLSPDTEAVISVPFSQEGSQVRFSVPSVVVYTVITIEWDTVKS